MSEATNGSQAGLTKGARITGDQRSSLGATFGQRYASGESIRSIAQDTGRSYGFVHGVLKESGASLRGRGGATRGPRRAGATSDEASPVAVASQETASPARTKAKARAEKDKPAGKLADKIEKVGDKVAEKVAKAKSAKDDKGKKKPEPKKASKKGKKG